MAAMNGLGTMLDRLGERYGVLAESSTSQLTVIARNQPVFDQCGQ